MTDQSDRVRAYFRKGHDRWLNTLGADQIKEVEHIRIPDTRVDAWGEPRWTPAWTHIAVVVLVTGECFVGVHRTARDKQYVRKTGYRAALGKGLAKAARSHLANLAPWKDLNLNPDFMIDNELVGRECYEAVKKELARQNRLRP